ncbi:MAG: aldehyde dehydrogenase family protein [Armatimonadetes bacterium]|nr:aldehyde dehydrogenase family protein [Armatimonadota bacterium]
MAIPHIPALRRGQNYTSLDKTEIKNVRTGEIVAEVSQVNAGLIKRDMRHSKRSALASLTTAQLLEISKRAGDLFMEGTLPVGDSGTQSAQDYLESLSATSGLPHSLIRKNMAKIYEVFTEMSTILGGLTRGMDLDIIDKGAGRQNGVPVSFFPTTQELGVVLPSNSPGVNSLWMPAIALKTPVVLKPGREEPWTPFRIIQAFIAAGCPAEAFSFYPTDHEGSGTILQTCGRALIFGDVKTVERYASNPAVEVHGPGYSKIILGDDKVDNYEAYLDIIVKSIVENGGRSCINASAVIVPRKGEEIANAIAKRLAQVVPLSYTDPNAILSGFANPAMAEFINSTLTEDLKTPGATDVTAQYRASERLVQYGGSTYLLPTVVYCQKNTHSLANREFLFPYASVLEVPQSEIAEKIGPSLVVTLISNDESFVKQMMDSPHVERLNIGAIPTMKVQWDQPHEGNLFEFLYRRRSIQWA